MTSWMSLHLPWVPTCSYLYKMDKSNTSRAKKHFLPSPSSNINRSLSVTDLEAAIFSQQIKSLRTDLGKPKFQIC